MNLLGHLLLADRHGLSLAGTLLGDFVKGPLPESDDARTRAIRAHRETDAFTETHPAFCASKRRLRPELGHWRGVAVDVFYDHVLARDFVRYAAEPLETFTARVYADLAAARARLPAPVAALVERMVATDLLGSYRRPRGVARALRSLASRSRRAVLLPGALADLRARREELAGDFAAFYADLTTHMRRFAGRVDRA